MNAHELRNGNWLHSELTNKDFQVNPDDIRSIWLGYDRGMVKTIPLTEEWLLKFGFSDKDYKNGYIGKDFKSGGMILDFVLSKPFSKGEWNNTYTFDFDGHRFSKMEFVHELQNLFFALTGNELSIENEC